MHPAYFEVRFASESHWKNPVVPFAIITAYQTTGQVWPQAANLQADERLRQTLEALGVWYQRLTGYSPVTGHAEPGWAVAMDFEQACDLGRQFEQDAIYYVDGDELTVSHCDDRRGKVHVGTFRKRLHRKDARTEN
jgi:hypothetical protein